MLVEAILQTKGNQVHTLPASANLAEAVATLNTHNIGAIVIAGDKGEVVGILSERDVVRQLGGDPAATLRRSIAEVMTKNVITCSRQTLISEIMDIMTRQRFRHMPVVDDAQLSGIISIGDVVKHKIREIEREAESLREYISS